MGCDTYKYNDTYIHFSEGDDNTRCLCTFPHNDDEVLEPSRLRSLAYLGATIKLIHEGLITDEYVYLPYCLPKWIKEGIDKQIEVKDEEVQLGETR